MADVQDSGAKGMKQFIPRVVLQWSEIALTLAVMILTTKSSNSDWLRHCHRCIANAETLCAGLLALSVQGLISFSCLSHPPDTDPPDTITTVVTAQNKVFPQGQV